MNTQIQIFKNDYFGAIRATVDEKGEPMFCLSDLCRILDLNNPTMVKNRLKQDGLITNEGVVKIGKRADGTTYEQIGQLTYVNEANFYKVVFQSRKEEAEYFTDWVTSEVLPSIRKHGAYLTPSTIEQALLNPDTIIKIATQLKEEQEARRMLQEKTELQQKEIMQAKPKVEYFDEVLQSKSTYTTNQIAKELGMSAIGLNKILKNLQIQYKQNGTWLLHYSFQNKGYTRTKTFTYTDSYGETRTSMQTVWTELGRKFIHEKLKKYQPERI